MNKMPGFAIEYKASVRWRESEKSVFIGISLSKGYEGYSTEQISPGREYGIYRSVAF